VIAKPRTIESRTVMYVKASMCAKFANQKGLLLGINGPGSQSMFRIKQPGQVPTILTVGHAVSSFIQPTE